MRRVKASHSHISPRARGFTVVELLVVVGAIGLLTAIFLPAVQSMRETARRATCESNLRQIGLAVNSHLSAKRRYPSGSVSKRYEQVPNTPWTFYRWSTLALITPYMDKSAVQYALDLDKPLYSIQLAVTEENVAGVKIHVPEFLCPSDDNGRPNPAFGPTNYAVCTGTGEGGGTPINTDGMFFVNSQLRPGDIADGLANTVMASESLLGGAGQAERRASRGYRFTQRAPLTQNACNSPVSWNYTDPRGFSWANGEYRTTLYNHRFAPNSPEIDCIGVRIAGGPETKYTPFGWKGARSLHKDGVNLVLADGSTRFVTTAIDFETWTALATVKDARLPSIAK